LQPLTVAWLALVALTLISPALGRWFHGADGLPLLVAAIVWIKGWLVARHFIEARLAHPFIARVLAGFIAFAPLENPKIAVCVTVDEGGHGGAVAGPIARAMIAAYLKIKPTAPAPVDAGD
jgi:hypothetical protein